MSESNQNRNAGGICLVRRERSVLTAQPGVIACCAGYGKSTYLTQLADEHEGSILVTLKPYDNTPERICEVIADALDRHTGFRNCCEAVRCLTAALSERPAGLLLVDDADAVTDGAVCACLEQLMAAAEAGKFRLLMAGRSVPGFAVTAVMDGRARLLGIREMRFTRAETAECVRSLRSGCPEQYINALYRFTGGWCAAVNAVAEAAQTAEDIPRSVHRTLLGRYIGTQILPFVSDDLAEYLEMTALLRGQGDDFSTAVFRIHDGTERAERLVTGGFLAEGENGAPEYPEVMRAVLAARLPAERRRELIDRASEYYIRKKNFAEAIALFEVSGNTDAAEHILRLYGQKFLDNYEFGLIGYCGNILDQGRGTSDPEVLGILAQYYYYCGKHQQMEAALNMADSRFGKENRYSVCRKLYNGLLRYSAKPELYSENVRSACAYLEAHSLPLPFLNQQEKELLDKICSDERRTDKLHIYRFGTLRLSVGDRELQCKSRKSLELVAFMLENGGKPMPREALLDHLWSDGIPTNAVAMLHNIIYDLRRELAACGLRDIVVYKNKCYLLDMSMIAEDDSEILAACEAAEASDVQRLMLHEAVLESYWGRYLGTLDNSHVQEQKEYHDRCFVTASLMAAGYYHEKNDYKRELVFLRNASAIDPFSEEIVCSYIQCCFAQGKPDQAKKKYDAYAELIDRELGITPSKWLRKNFLSGFAVAAEGGVQRV